MLVYTCGIYCAFHCAF